MGQGRIRNRDDSKVSILIPIYYLAHHRTVNGRRAVFFERIGTKTFIPLALFWGKDMGFWGIAWL
jgi:hypothetical protein